MFSKGVVLLFFAQVTCLLSGILRFFQVLLLCLLLQGVLTLGF